MPRRSPSGPKPTTWLVNGQWPDGEFDEEAPDAVAYAVHVSEVLDEALRGANKTHVAAQAGIERSTLYDLLTGNTWPDLVTLAKLEGVLEVTLWPLDRPTLRRQRQAGARTE